MARPPTADIERDEFREHARRLYESQKWSVDTLLEEGYWATAMAAPFGGRFVPYPPGDDPYLMRVYLAPERSSGSGLRSLLPRPYLHFFFRGDEDREVHNHPWVRSVSVILAGGYTEYRWNPITRKLDSRQLRPGDINVIRRDDFHRVELSEPGRGCWTLFTTSRRAEPRSTHDWHFLDTETGKLTPWGAYVPHHY